MDTAVREVIETLRRAGYPADTEYMGGCTAITFPITEDPNGPYLAVGSTTDTDAPFADWDWNYAPATHRNPEGDYVWNETYEDVCPGCAATSNLEVDNPTPETLAAHAVATARNLARNLNTHNN